MDGCLFCKIGAGKIPSDKLYEDDEILAFRDIDPQAPVHFLVIPKKHIDSAACLTEADAPLLGRLLTVAQTVAAEASGVGTLTATGRAHAPSAAVVASRRTTARFRG